MADSGRAQNKEYFPELLLLVSLSSRWETATPTSAGDPPTLADRSGSVSYSVTAPSPGSWCAQYFVCALQEWSLFPPVLSKSCNQIPLAFKSDSLGIPPPVAGPPDWEAWHGAQNLHSSGWTSLVLLFSSLWVTHLAVLGFDFIVIAPILPSHCGFSSVFGCGVSFLMSSSIFLSMIVQQLVVIPVLLQEGVQHFILNVLHAQCKKICKIWKNIGTKLTFPL